MEEFSNEHDCVIYSKHIAHIRNAQKKFMQKLII